MDINREEEIRKVIKNLPTKKTKITDNSIADFQMKIGWLGTGKGNDPIILNNLSGLNPKIKIHRSSLHYVIREVVVYNLKCINTQNILIENCKIKLLEIEGCYNITIRNNSILELDWVFSKGCTLENNSFSKDVLKRLENNYFNKLYPKVQKYLCGFSSIFIILSFLIFTFSIKEWYIGVFNLCIFAGLFYFILSFKVSRNRTHNKPENILVGNKNLPDFKKKKIFHEILENYI